jgi:hypothetical protein
MKRLLLVACVLAAAACSKPGAEAQPTAEAFLDHHYVHIDLESAKSLASGLARDKIEKEIELTKDQQIDGETLEPHVGYSLHRAEEAGTAAQFAYELTIRAPGADPFRKLVTVTVRNTDGVWAVTNFGESDVSN